MKTNVLNVAGTTIGTVRTSLARLTNKVSSQVKNLLEALDCPIETAADAHYVKCTLACLLSPICPPLLAVAAYQLYQAQTKKGGTI